MDSEENDSDGSIDITSAYVSRETTLNLSEEYESDSSVGVNDNSSMVTSSVFIPVANRNVFLSRFQDEILLGLSQKQQVYISGVFDVEILKGGIMYNSVYHNSERKDPLTFIHPLSSSIPSIQSSHFDGWKETINTQLVSDKFITFDKVAMDNFTCIIKLTNSKKVTGLENISKLYVDLKFFWKPKDYKLFDNSIQSKLNFAILYKLDNNFIPLEISKDWLQLIDKLTLFHKNSEYDMRTLIIGGKNSGKSTLLRLLLEKFITDNESLQYLDLDPGQPEYSDPECISIAQFDKLSCFGSNWGKLDVQLLKQFYLGVNSPQDNPTHYLRLVDQIMDFFEEQNFPGSSFVNLPGWIKGFGINILNHVLKKYKPTHVILLSPNNRLSLFSELDIPSRFSSELRESYEPIVINLSSYHMHQQSFNIANTQDSIFGRGSNRNGSFNSIDYNQLKIQPAQLRILRTLLSMHTIKRKEGHVEFNFTPLLMQRPLQISFGKSQGIKGIQFYEEFSNIHMDDMKISLEGTIVGLHTIKDNDQINNGIRFNGIYPILQDNSIDDMSYVTTLLIHSIDEKNQLMNVYIPFYKISEIQAMFDENTVWIIKRGKAETPMCELTPPKNCLGGVEFIETPYITKERRKKYEYVWKVRKNVQRRGQSMK